MTGERNDTREEEDCKRTRGENADRNQQRNRQPERLEFMYAPPMAANKEKEEEEYALGKPVEAIDAKDKEKEKEKASNVPGSIFGQGEVKSQNELWQRMTHDPLVAIKLQEEQALRRIRENPVRMEAIRSQIDQLEAQKRPHRIGGREHKDVHRGRSRSRSHSPGSRHERRYRRGESSKEVRHRDARRHRSSHRSRSPRGESRRGRWEERSSRDRRRSRSPPYDERRDRYGSRTDRTGNHGHGSDVQSTSHRRCDGREGRGTSPGRPPARFNEHSPGQTVHDSASAQRSSRYGLQVPEGLLPLNDKPGGLSMPERATRDTTTTSSRPMAGRGRSVRDRNGSDEGRRSSGKLSEEEKARRLSEMAQNADTHEVLKRSRLAEAAEADRRDVYSSVEQVNRQLRHHTSKAAFLSEAGRSLFSTDGSRTLEEQLSRRRRGPGS